MKERTDFLLVDCGRPRLAKKAIQVCVHRLDHEDVPEQRMKSQAISPATDPKQVARQIRADIKKRAEVGIGKALADLILEPNNPFDPTLGRRPRKLAILIGLVVLAALFCFGHFNLST
jgi:hypothetical protein